MSYRLVYLPTAKKDIRRLDHSVRPGILKALKRLEENPEIGKPLSDTLAGYYSLRTSDYRIIYTIRNKQLVVVVVSIGHRREVYDKLRKLLR